MEKLYRCIWASTSYIESYTNAENEEEAREKFEACDDRGFDECYEENVEVWEILGIEEEHDE